VTLSRPEKPVRHEIDVSIASDARIYDWLLGGRDNYPPDRHAGLAIHRFAPAAWVVARNNRAFMRRAVRVLAQDFGVRRILDLGSGMPASPNVYEIAQRIDPATRVISVDNDALAQAHARMLLDQNERTTVLPVTDISDVDALMDEPGVADLVGEGVVAVLAVAVLHCLDRPDDVMRALVRRLRPGTFLTVSLLVSDDPAVRDGITDIMHTATDGAWGRVATAREAVALFDGLDLVPPGIVDVDRWRPNQLGPDRSLRQRSSELRMYGAVARVP
jgi:SAM-dependent methyltransferase